jgi:hypothetical protein
MMADPYALLGLCQQYLREPSRMDASTVPPTLTFAPALSAAEQATYADLLLMYRFGVSVTLAEWQAIKPDAALLRTFAGIASPTLAQTAAATKAQSRILAVIVRS